MSAHLILFSPILNSEPPWVPSWTSDGNDITAETWQAVAFGNGKFIAVNSTAGSPPNRIRISSDGLTWVASSTLMLAFILKCIAYGEGTWVALPSSGLISPRGAYSLDDGVTWTQVAGVTIAANAVAYGNGMFIAVGGTGGVEKSLDGITWNLETSGNTTTWFGIAYGNGRWVAVGGSGTGTRVMYSDNDGVTWTVSAAYPSDAVWRSVAYGNGRFVAVASSSGTDRGMYSTDGITWYSSDLPLDKVFYAVAFGNGVFVAVDNVPYYSTDGATWLAGGAMPETGNWRSLAYGAGRFVSLNQLNSKDSAIATI